MMKGIIMMSAGFKTFFRRFAKNSIWLACFSSVFLAAGVSSAAEVTFVITSEYDYIVDVEFYAQDRNIAWPGGNEVYSINDFKTHYYSLRCRYGERICYGAGVRGRYSKFWGVGIGNKYSCDDCCAVCGKGQTVNYILNR
jgi:hypothetical protein